MEVSAVPKQRERHMQRSQGKSILKEQQAGEIPGRQCHTPTHHPVGWDADSKGQGQSWARERATPLPGSPEDMVC